MNTKIFFLHHPKFEDRKKTLLSDIIKVSFDYPVDWVESYSPDDITNKYQHSISLNELSLSLKHLHVIQEQINNNIQNIIVFEDDIDLQSLPNVNIFLRRCITDINDINGDILWIGGTYGLQVPAELIQNNCISYFSNTFLSRCTHGYILNIKAAHKIIENYNFNLPVDHLFNKIIEQEKLLSGWTSPFLTQKTVEGIWKSTIR